MADSPDERRLRLRAVLNAQAAAILVVCLLLAAVGAGLVYTTHVDPGTATETRTVSSLTVESEYVHSAEVTEPNAVFETGTVLDDRNTYFARIAPELDVVVETGYAASSAEDVTVEVASTLVVRNVGEEGTVYWRDAEPLAAETVSDVAPGEPVNASFTLNSTAIDRRVGSIEDQLGASPGTTETVVTTEVTVDGTVGGVPTASTQTLEMTLDHGGATYTVDEPGVRSDTTERTEQVPVERSYGTLRSFGGPLLLLLGLVGAGGTGYLTREYDLALTDREREYLSYRDDRSEFDEWITTFRLPGSVHDRPEAEAATLRDLIDFAIDNDTGVVEDPATGAFHAVAGEFVYTYRPPVPDTDDGPADESDGDGLDGDEAPDPTAFDPDDLDATDSEIPGDGDEAGPIDDEFGGAEAVDDEFGGAEAVDDGAEDDADDEGSVTDRLSEAFSLGADADESDADSADPGPDDESD